MSRKQILQHAGSKHAAKVRSQFNLPYFEDLILPPIEENSNDNDESQSF